MRRHPYVFPIFIICFLLAFFTFIFSQKSLLNSAAVSLQLIFSPVQKLIFHTTQSFHPQSSEDTLRSENARLKTQIAKDQLISEDNAAFRDQFHAVNPSPENLIPASVVGMPSFFPGVNAPETFIVDKGMNDKITINTVAVYKDTLIGKVTKANAHFSEITLTSNKTMSFTVKTSQTDAIGVLKGLGNGEMILDNVVLSDTLKVGDTVVTSGSTDLQGKGFPPGLVVGKIISVDKNPSALFQKASVESLINVSKLPMVFMVLSEK